MHLVLLPVPYTDSESTGSHGVGILLGPHVEDKVILMHYVDDNGETTQEESRLNASANSHVT